MKKLICVGLALVMSASSAMVAFGADNTSRIVNDEITVDESNFGSMEHGNVVGWNGWDDWNGNNPSQYSRFMSATIEKDPMDQSLSFTDANKAFQFTLQGIYNTTGRPAGAISCDSNMHINKIFDSAKTGKVRVNTKLYNDSTEEGKAASFHFVIGDEESQNSSSLEKRLLNLEIAGSAIYVKSNFGETGQASATITNAVPYGKWFALSTEIDTNAKTWAIYIDGKKVGNGVFGGAVNSVNLVAYSIDRSGNTAFKNSSNPDKMVKWYADDLEVQTYSEPSTATMPSLLSKWQTVASDNFEGVTAPLTINNFAAQYPRIKINSGVTGAFDRYQDVSIVKQDDNNILHMEQLTKSGANGQNVRAFWRLFENGGNIDNGCVKVSMRINGENSNDKSFYIYATKEITDWSQTAQIDPNSATGSGQALNEIRIWGGDHIAFRSQAGDYSGYNVTAWNKNMGWAKLDIIYNLSLKKYTVWINDKRVEFNGISQGECPFYSGDDWNIGSIALRIPRDQGGQTWLVDDISVSVLDGWTTVEKEDITDVFNTETDVLPSNWVKTGDVVTTVEKDNNDPMLLIKENGTVYRTFDNQNGILTMTADVFANSDTAEKSIYTSDNNENKFVLASIDTLPSNTWAKVKIVADMTNRIYDVYLDNNKIVSNKNFDTSNNGLMNKIGFSTDGGNMYINNLVIDRTEPEYKLAITNVQYADASDNEVVAPCGQGTVKSVTINNTNSDLQPALLIVAVYKDNALYSVSSKYLDSTTPIGLSTLSAENISIPADWNSNCDVKAFCWNYSDILPISEEYSYR